MVAAWWIYPLLFAAGVVAGFVNVLAGAGSALTLPLLIFAGLGPVTANGSNRVGILLENLLAAYRFQKHGLADVRLVWGMVPWILPGALLGAWSSIHVGGALFQKILVVVLGISAVTLFLPKSWGEKVFVLRERFPWALYPALLLLGFYGGFVQAGIGFLFIFVLRTFVTTRLARVNAYKTLIIASYTLPVLLVFAFLGEVAWSFGIAIAMGGLLGANLATKVSLGKRGELWIKVVIATVITMMAAHLWLV